MCENEGYTERGIKGIHGFASEKFKIDENFALKVDEKLKDVAVLMEPTSVVVKAWEQSLRIAARSSVLPRTALITGSGPVGLLAALIGKQKGFETHIFDHNETGVKPTAAKGLGVTYHSDLESLERSGFQFDIVIECTGVPDVIVNLFQHIKSDGILCLTGVSSGGHSFPIDIGALNLQIVLQNQVIFGSVNANRRHYEDAEKALMTADPEWLKSLITRKIPLAQFSEGFKKQKSDIKIVLVP
jgi:threonine dehydrogenase-like Zn-dependent dehydrogenase